MFNHYVAVDWAMSNMAIARMTEKSNKIMTIDVPSDLKELKLYLKNLKGKICLTIEETTTSQWLYTELNEYVEKLIVCDPFRNRLLSEGAKTDKIDAEKLVKLLRSDLLKEAYHSNDIFIELRKIISTYEDTIKAGVRLKNQRSALFRAYNKNHKNETELIGEANLFVFKGIDRQIESYENERFRYQKKFRRLRNTHKEIKRLSDIPGIEDISAVKIISRVVTAHRFPTRNNFLSYCGLVKLDKISGGKSYGKKTSRFCRMMKNVFKMSALATIYGKSQFGEKYRYLIESKNYTERDARNAVARQIATVTYGVIKSNQNYDPLKHRKMRKELLCN